MQAIRCVRRDSQIDPCMHNSARRVSNRPARHETGMEGTLLRFLFAPHPLYQVKRVKRENELNSAPEGGRARPAVLSHYLWICTVLQAITSMLGVGASRQDPVQRGVYPPPPSPHFERCLLHRDQDITIVITRAAVRQSRNWGGGSAVLRLE